MRKLLLYIIPVVLLTSCLKEEDPMEIPPPGDLKYATADIGQDYSKSVFINLSGETQQTRVWADWDLAFEVADNGGYIWLNTGKYMFSCHSGASDFAQVDTTGKEWKIDNDQLLNDSNAIGAWWINPAGSDVMVIDRGRVLYTGINAGQRFKKIKVENVDATQYKVTFCNYNSSTPTVFFIPKTPDRSRVYFSFDGGGKMVDYEPAKNEWEFVLTRYTHIYYSEPVNSVYRHYLVNGGLNNKWNGITGMRMIKDVTPGYVPFSEMNASVASGFTFSNDANTIGFEWKTVDTNTGAYTITPDIYYLLKTSQGYIYKIRFIGFYDINGNKGHVAFEYQRL